MQTRRDQLQAYRFQNRRALAALVTGEPNVLEAPMRRLTVTTISGIMIAVLIGTVFLLIGFLKPDSGGTWRAAGSIIVVRNTPTIYVMLSDKKLHPVVNYASAVLAVASKATPHVVYVDESDLGKTERGAEIGINSLPQTFPSAGSVVPTPWTVCSRQVKGPDNNLLTRVTVYVGDTITTSPVPADKAVLATGLDGVGSFLLEGGMRYPVDASGSVGAFLSLQTASAVTVGSAFLDSIPTGPALAAPKVDGAGTKITKYSLPNQSFQVGQVLDIDGGSTQLIALADGVAPLTPVQAALLLAVKGSDGQPLRPATISRSDEGSILSYRSQGPWNTIKAEFGDIPQSLPSSSTAPAAHGGLCARYGKDATEPTFSTPPDERPAYPGSAVNQSDLSRSGKADAVTLAPGTAALVQFVPQKTTVFFVAAPGLKYSAPSTAALKGFGYAGVHPVQLPVQLEQLIPDGPAFDATAALEPPAN